MKKIRIAICDDEKEISGFLEEHVAKYIRECGRECEIEVFYDGEALCQDMQINEYDLVFLDIELPDITGVDIGRFIREELCNEVVQIAYISAKKQYAMKLFEYRPINFLVKPLKYEDIAKIIDKYFRVTEYNDVLFTYKKKYELYKVKLSDILYLQSQGRTVTIVTMQGTDTFYGSLEKIYSDMKCKKFIFIHKSYVVNYAYITSFEMDSVTLTTGEKLPISQARRKAVNEMLLKLVMEER